MLTPRHQALVATLAGMTVGVAVFGVVLAINRDPTSDASNGVLSTPSVSTPTTPGTTNGSSGLQADSLTYTVQTFGTDRMSVSAEVPAGWKSLQTGSRPRFLDPTGIWQLRFDTRGSRQSPDQLVKARAASIDEPDLVVLSRNNGTLVYTYTDQTRGPRMGLSRWLPADNADGSAIEITVGGRPQDEGGLRAVLDHATKTLNRPGNLSNRPN